MKRIMYWLFTSVLFSALSVSALGDEESSAGGRETVLDRKVHIERDLILDIPKMSRLCDEMDIWKRQVHIGDCSLYCEQEGKGIPIVLLHGGPGATHHYFHPSFSRAKDFSKVVYYDQRGCGISQYWAGNGYSIDQAVDDLDRLREALGIGKWIVLGHSYGGTLAQCYTVKHPENVAGLVLVDSACYGLPVDMTRTRQYDFMSREEQAKISEIHNNANLTNEQELFNAHLNGDWKRQSFYRPSKEQLARMSLYEWKQDKEFRSAIIQSLNRLDLRGRFDKCPVPVLIMEGKWDLTWDQDKPKKIQACFPGSKLVIFDRSGHSPFEDEPEKFFSVLKEFVQSLRDVSETQVSSWKEHLAKIDKEKEKPGPTAVSNEVVFRTAQVAPSGFNSWTFHWTAPGIEPDATLQYVVLQPDGKEYFRYALPSNSLKKGQSIRSDFAKGLAGGDPKVLYNQHIIIKFTVDKGQIAFPENAQFRFEFNIEIKAVKQ